VLFCNNSFQVLINMNNAIYTTPPPTNEPVLDYAPGSPERASLQATLDSLKSDAPIDIPAFIGGRPVPTDTTSSVVAPHDHQHTLAHLHQCGPNETQQAIDAAMDAKAEWASMDWEDRAAIFLRAADLLAGPWRDRLNASTMLGQSKSAHQAEIDAACELIDFFRFNVHYMEQIYREQPGNAPGVWNHLQYRPLEGFVLAVTPFNFTSIQANLPTAPALMGNTVLWKPSSTSAYSAYFIYKLLEEAGLPPGVINMLPADDGAQVGNTALASKHFAGLHFTGSEGTFQHLWKQIGANLDTYRTFPTIVGETGGKDFIVAHPSANMEAVTTAIVRGSFEYQGQKCSAASRIYVPASEWGDMRAALAERLNGLKMGPPEDFTNFINAVIDEKAFTKITGYIQHAETSDDADVVIGGSFNHDTGYFIQPTVIRAHDPRYQSMEEEIFGPVATVYVYPDDEFEATLDLVDETSPYGLTGAIFATDRDAVDVAQRRLEHAAGNFYINDKPTGAVVGQQPFGGARRSGTNDKAGSRLNLERWVSPRAIKENLNPPTDHTYSFLAPDATESAEPTVADSGNGSIAN
jgi:1-pyrroline-5-carboxylate dehydrogenase